MKGKRVTYIEATDMIVITFDPFKPAYVLELSRIRSAEEYMGMVINIANKPWMTIALFDTIWGMLKVYGPPIGATYIEPGTP